MSNVIPFASNTQVLNAVVGQSDTSRVIPFDSLFLARMPIAERELVRRFNPGFCRAGIDQFEFMAPEAEVRAIVADLAQGLPTAAGVVRPSSICPVPDYGPSGWTHCDGMGERAFIDAFTAFMEARGFEREDVPCFD